MKKLSLLLLLQSVFVLAQAPQKMSYQSVLRNSANELVVNQNIGVKISIIQVTFFDTVVYTETHSATTNDNGLFTLEVGGGTALTGTFAAINWAGGSHYIKSQIDLTGGTNYTIEVSKELLSVPYALYAGKTNSSSNSWALNGNAGTVNGTNFIGTTDNVPLNFKVNNQNAGKIDPSLNNTFFGSKAGNSNTTGQNNTAVGSASLQTNTTGVRNTAIGSFALNNNISGDNNVAIGYAAYYQQSTGNENVFIGNSICRYDTAERNKSIVIGHDGWCAPNAVNAISIGYQSLGVATNEISIGNASSARMWGPQYILLSDRRIKDNIVEGVHGLDFITKLRPITYNLNVHKMEEFTRKSNKDVKDWPGKYDNEKKLSTGFIAQEVEQAAKEVGYDFDGVAKPNDGGLYGLSYSEFVVPLVKAVQKQQQMIES